MHSIVARAHRARSSVPHQRHEYALSPNDLTNVEGFSCTSVDRTLFDLTRTEPFTVALACAEAQLRQRARIGSRANTDTWGAWRDDIRERRQAAAGGRGTRALHALETLASPLSDSPLESVSKLRFLQLGVEVEQQVEVRAEHGGSLALDFRLIDARVWGECDGRTKYAGEHSPSGLSPEDVIYREKRRHDWITGTTGLRGIRWGVREVTTVARFAAHLRACHVKFPGSPVRLLGTHIAEFLDTCP